MKSFKVILAIILFLTQLIWASEIKGEDTNVEIKKGGAIMAFSKDDGFKLSNKAMKNLDITFSRLKGNLSWEIPKSALIRIKHSVGVYRRWNGWITMVLVNVLSQTKDTVTIKSVDLENKDEIAISGVLFLRMTDADLNSDTVDSCTH